MSIFLAWYILVEEDFLNLKTSSKYGFHVLLFEIIRVKNRLFLIFPYILRKSSKGQITISSESSPVVGIEYLAIPFAFDFAFKTHIKEKSFKHSIN